MVFFDEFPRFYSTSTVGSEEHRLNSRYRAIIEPNVDCIQGSTILDIASHDGRWSFCAVKAGARHVLGVEPRSHLVAKAYETFHAYGIPTHLYSFISDDIFEQLPKITASSIDTVFCLGFFYHTMHHQWLLDRIARLRPKHLILDTYISRSPNSIIDVSLESTELDSNIMRSIEDGETNAVVGHPSWSALEMMLTQLGFRIQQFDWQANIRGDGTNLEDYRDGKRVTLRCDR